MLDKVRSVVKPSGLEAERNEIQGELDRLNADREAARLDLGRMALEAGSTNGPLSGGDRERTAATQTLAGLDERIKTLRTRRRELDKILAPKPEAETVKAGVKLPPELVKLQDRLDAARAERMQLVALARDAETPKESAQHVAKVRQIEEKIAQLRIERADALIPYNSQVVESVAPVVARAAARALEGATMVREALDELQNIATIMPSTVPGGLPPLWPAAAIDRRPLIAAQNFARDLIEGIER